MVRVAARITIYCFYLLTNTCYFATLTIIEEHAFVCVKKTRVLHMATDLCRISHKKVWQCDFGEYATPRKSKCD